MSPAASRWVVEQQAADGTRRELAARFTIEFRAQAARPRTRLKREFTVPVEVQTWSAGHPAREKLRGEGAAPPVFPPLRIAVRGIGQDWDQPYCAQQRGCIAAQPGLQQQKDPRPAGAGAGLPHH